MNDFIAITIGDIKGIGVNILINAWKNKKIKNFIILSDIKVINEFLIKNKIKCETNIINIIMNIKITAEGRLKAALMMDCISLYPR